MISLSRVWMSTVAWWALTATIVAPAVQDDIPSPELPSELSANLDPDRGWATEIHYPFEASGDSGRALVTFSNEDEDVVRFHWKFRVEGGASLILDQVVPTSFAPTAVSKRALRSNTVYVAGYLEGSGLTVVEEWTFRGLDLRLVPPGVESHPLRTELVDGLPTIDRRIVFLSSPVDPMKPLYDLACNPFSDTLVVLPLEDEQAIRIIDVGSGRSRVHSLLGDYDAFETGRSVKAGMHSEGGLVLVVKQTAGWLPVRKPGGALWVVLTDRDLDGEFESAERLEASSFAERYRSGSWILYVDD